MERENKGHPFPRRGPRKNPNKRWKKNGEKKGGKDLGRLITLRKTFDPGGTHSLERGVEGNQEKGKGPSGGCKIGAG